EWPEPLDLPDGYRFVSMLTATPAIQAAGLPEGLVRDASLFQYGRVEPGNSEILYLRFRSRDLRKKWMLDESAWRRSGWRRRTEADGDGVWLFRNVPKEAEVLLEAMDAAAVPAIPQGP